MNICLRVYTRIHACHFGPLMSNLKRPHFPFAARVLPASMWTGSKRATISCFVWARQKTVWIWYKASACTHFYPRFLYVRFSSQHFLIILWQFMCPVARCGKKIPTWSRELQLGCLKHQTVIVYLRFFFGGQRCGERRNGSMVLTSKRLSGRERFSISRQTVAIFPPGCDMLWSVELIMFMFRC